jgi:hypothetical protein
MYIYTVKLIHRFRGLPSCRAVLCADPHGSDPTTTNARRDRRPGGRALDGRHAGMDVHRVARMDASRVARSSRRVAGSTRRVAMAPGRSAPCRREPGTQEGEGRRDRTIWKIRAGAISCSHICC